jgi:hypothetical protein
MTMTIGFSKNWTHHSWSKREDGNLSQEHEKAWIEYMIHHCDSDTVREYAESDPDLGKGVYVRTGIHVSKTEPQRHVEAFLGSDGPAGYTAHILWGEGQAPFHVDLVSDVDLFVSPPARKRVAS